MLFGKKKPKDYALSLDIGTEYVKALIFEVTDDSKGIIVGVGREHQRLTDMQSGTVTDIRGVAENCELAINKAAETAKIIPEKVVIGIAGELVKGSTSVVEYVRPEPDRKINEEELNQIISKVQHKAFAVARQELAYEMGLPEVDVKLINAAVVDVKIDGYAVTNPLGFQGKNVAVGVYNSYAPLVHLGALQSVADELKLDLISIAAEPYAVARGFRDSGARGFGGIFIDIGGGTTDIAVVSEGGVVGTQMFAIGGRLFTKRLMNEYNLSFNKAENLKLDYAEGKLKEEQMREIDQLMNRDTDVWILGVETALREFSALDLLPPRVYLCGGGAALPTIMRALKRPGWHRTLPFASPPQTSFIRPEDVERMSDKTGSLDPSQDITPMGLGVVALDVYESESKVQSIMKKVVQMMRQ